MMNAFLSEILTIARAQLSGCDHECSPFIFGGAVRDLIANVDYNDIDVYFGGHSDRDRYIGKLRTALKQKYGNDKVKVTETSLDDDHSLYDDCCPNVSRRVFTITHDGKEVDIQFDFFTPSDNGDDLSAENMDISVNSLTMNCYGDINSLGGMADVAITKEQIKKRELVQIRNDVSDYRLKKVGAMIENGWAHAADYLEESSKRNLPVGTKVWVKSNGYVLPGIVMSYSAVHDQYQINHLSGARMNNYLPFRNVIGKLIENPVHKDSSKKDKMGTSKSAVEGVVDTLKSDGKKAAWRTFAKQIPKAARAGLLAFMKAKGAKKAWIKTASEMMDTEMGRAVISLMLGWAIYAIPALRKDPRAAALAEEWRVEAMSTVGDELIQEAMIHFGPVMSLMSDIPMPPTKLRVAGDEEVKAEAAEADSEEESKAEQEAEEAVKKAARAVA